MTDRKDGVMCAMGSRIVLTAYNCRNIDGKTMYFYFARADGARGLGLDRQPGIHS